ncbi:MAG TPA: hypothetical protein VG276_25355 [Actinomycetes bacterium]|jgi:hypothetical protein|nr:hypothetical protein [Actinomycetes bacterium]
MGIMVLLALLTLLVVFDLLAIRRGVDSRPGFEIHPHGKSMTGAGLTVGPRGR